MVHADTRNRRSRPAFTLVELLVVITIIVVLSGLAIAFLTTFNGTESSARGATQVQSALTVARIFHVIMLFLLIALLITFALGKLAIAGVVAVAVLLAYEHSLVSPNDLSKLNAAFFTMNGVIAVVFFFFMAADFLFKR